MKRIIQAVLLLVVIAGTFGGYYYWVQWQKKPPVSPSTPAIAPAITPPAASVAAPEIHHPIESAPAAAPLPDLEQSDGPMMSALRELLGQKSLALLFSDQIIHRVVATVDALPRPQLPVSIRPLKPVAGSFITAGKDTDLAIAPGNTMRYAPYTALARAIDVAGLVDLYRRFYPLFQQAYRELGYPKGYFNDRLIETIDDLLATPEPTEPVRLAQPKVLYVYADPDLESRSAGQKIMIRMGVDNQRVIKGKLREIRQLLTDGMGKRR